MGLMFARRRIEEAARRASNKTKAQKERHEEAKANHTKANASKDGKNGADTKGTK